MRNVVSTGERCQVDTKIFGYFIELQRCQSYSRAAQRLHISSQGLYGAMKRLEGEVGVPLFDTSLGATALTEYGKVVLEYAECVEGSLTGMRSALDTLQTHARGVIRLGCSVGLVGYLGEQVIDDFNETSDESQVLVTDELPDLQCERHLLADKYDLGLVTNPVVCDDLVAIPMVEDYQFLWINKRNRLASLDEVCVADLAGQTVIAMNDEYKGTDRLLRLCDEQGVNVRIRLTGEMIRVYEFALANRALGLTCRNHIEAMADSDKVTGVPFKSVPWGFSLCYRKDHVLTGSEIEFIDYMRGKRRVYR